MTTQLAILLMVAVGQSRCGPGGCSMLDQNQCYGSQCYSYQYRGPFVQKRVDQQSVIAKQSVGVQRVPQMPKALVMVTGDYNEWNQGSWGNGVVIQEIDGDTLVATALHVLADVNTYNINGVPATIWRTDAQCDLAIMRCAGRLPDSSFVEAATSARIGEPCRWIGYKRGPGAGTGTIEAMNGRGSVKAVRPGWIRCTGPMPPDSISGSAIVNGDGYLIGLVSGYAPGEGYYQGCSVDAIRDLLLRGKTTPAPKDDEPPPLPLTPDSSPGEDDETVVDPSQAIIPLNLKPIVEEHTTQIIEINKTLLDLTRGQGEIDKDLLAKIEAMEQRVAKLENMPKPVLMQGDKGDEGPPGKDAVIDDKLKAEIAAMVVKKLPPLTVNVTEKSGRVIQQEVHLGGPPLDLVFVPPIKAGSE